MSLSQEHTASSGHWSYPSMKERVEAEGTPIAIRLYFQYRNSAGDISFRAARITHFLAAGADTFMVGHCELRGERRVFRASRMTDLHQLGPGSRVVDVHRMLFELAGVAEPRRQSSAGQRPPPRRAAVSTGTGYMALQLTRGRVFVPESVYLAAQAAPDAEEAAACIRAQLPALADDLLGEVLATLRAG